MYLEKKDNNLIGKLVFRLVKKHIAGSTSSAVLNVVRDLNDKGMHTTVTLLNDHVDDQTKARYNANAYIQFIKQLSRLQLDSDVSLRPSQIGSLVDSNLLEWNMNEIVNAVNSGNHRLWLEEEASGMGEIVRLYRKFRPKCDSLGVEVRPDYDDEDGDSVSKLFSNKDVVKLRCHVDERKAHPKKVDKLKLYRNYIDILMAKRANLTILEHDQKLIGKLVSSSKDYKKNLIFEIPLGYNGKVSKSAKGKLNMSVYVPYGKDWIPYFINRLAEGRVRNIAVTLLDGQKKVVDSNARKKQGKG